MIEKSFGPFQDPEDHEIIVFTASHNCYANKVLDYLDPKGELIHQNGYF